MHSHPDRDRSTGGALTFLEVLRTMEPSDRLLRYAEEQEAELRKRRPAGFAAPKTREACPDSE